MTTPPHPPVGPPLTRADLERDRPLDGRRVLIVVENLPVPFDRRVWMEARTLAAAGARVTVICPTGKGYETRDEVLEGIRVLRHPLPLDAKGAVGYLLEYGAALFWETVLAWRVWRRDGLDVIHGCNPPDLIFLVALTLRPFGVRYLFDHHDINPELYEAKFERRGPFWRLMVLFERLTFAAARVSIATNDSYRAIAIKRGRMKPEDVFVVRSGPDLSRVKAVPPVDTWRNGRRFLVGYVGVMGQQEGLDLLLEAARLLVQEHGREDIQFVLVGGGPSLDDIRQMAETMGLAPYVTLTGRAPDADLFAVLSTADVCVNPDRVNPMNDKSTMNKIMEYMALGKPIVQFEVTEGRVSAGEASLYAAPNDPRDMAAKIAALLDDPEARTRMGTIGRQRVEADLSWDHQIAPLVAAYRRVTADL
ncbi:glycosyltransferase family 4 protein [Roseospira marina]|uniref:glycosyltransferase family 4 protein n=1 Tax=Roseospira marina TaxID=140057 RepID=UPI001810D6EC|nr:glycosyltransferase family 4 protein [Roseospira marina]MBB4315678.1 glycosyltransferase involved in cell wall biosynthesis [Roseospira marina]MBB5088736.1 glycosyltransferase involved in cell wall biosynthesis [Roseospira marina]